MATYFRLEQKDNTWNVYLHQNPVEPHKRFVNLEMAERFIQENDRILGALDAIYAELNVLADRLAKEYHTDRHQSVAWLTVAMMRVAGEQEEAENSRRN